WVFFVVSPLGILLFTTHLCVCALSGLFIGLRFAMSKPNILGWSLFDQTSVETLDGLLFVHLAFYSVAFVLFFFFFFFFFFVFFFFFFFFFVFLSPIVPCLRFFCFPIE